ncbi:MAG: cell division protein FtsA [Chloroflexi bacterium]|nr:MAG: cell division protein FtsA [Chloroflexota bacterium]
MAKTFASIDVGTSKVCSILANLGDEDTIRILGVGVVPSKGVHKGLVVNIEEAKEAIEESVMKAERISGVKMELAYVGVTGKHISSLNSRGVVATTRSDRRVTNDDLSRVLESARSITIPSDRQLLHVIPRRYILDGQVEVREPVGMHGFRLDVETHVVTASIASVQNLVKSVRGAGVDIEDLILAPLAAGEAVLTEDEKNAGVVLADIGAGTTDVAIFKEGSVWHSAVISVGGHQLTRDISVGLGIPYELAEEMKKKYGNVTPGYDSREQPEKLELEDRHSISYRELCDIIRVRVEEILRLIFFELPSGKEKELVPAGLVLTGGTATLPGIDALGKEVLGVPVRVGMPGGISGIAETLFHPAFATSVGLLSWGLNHAAEESWKAGGFKAGLARTLNQSLSQLKRMLLGR